jgi:hypothetical protein
VKLLGLIESQNWEKEVGCNLSLDACSGKGEYIMFGPFLFSLFFHIGADLFILGHMLGDSLAFPETSE